MRALIRILLLLLLLMGLGVLGAQVASIRAVQGESGQANLWNAILITANDEMLRPLIIAGTAAGLIGLVGLVLVSVTWRPRATAAAEEGPEPETAPAE